MRLASLAAALMLTSCAGAPAPPAGTDADTVAWWTITGELSGDDLEGRDTGSVGYDRSAKYVADRFAKAGLKPAGENETWFQTLPLKEVRVEKDGTSFEIVRGDGTKAALRFLHQVTVRPTASLPAAIDAPLAFRGYCSADEMKDVAGKAVVCFGARRTGMTTGGQRLVNAADRKSVV